jgi:hypothetical protein
LKHLRSWLLKRKGPPSYLSDPHLLQTNQESYTTIQTAEVGLKLHALHALSHPKQAFLCAKTYTKVHQKRTKSRLNGLRLRCFALFVTRLPEHISTC